MQTTWLRAQQDAWSLWNQAKRYQHIFSPPINKLFYWFITKFAEAEFADFLEFLKQVEWPPRAGKPARSPGRRAPQRNGSRDVGLLAS